MKKLLIIFLLPIFAQAQIIKTTIGGIPAYAQLVGTGPAIIFLHGIGERGTDLELVMKYGPLAMIKAGSTEKHLLAANIVHLQLEKTKGSWPKEYVVNAIADLITKGADPDRIYLLGVSLGGMGVWACLGDPMVNKHLAAAVLMAPGGSPSGKEQIIADSNVPISIAHGKADLVVKFPTSEAAYFKINSLNDGQVLLTHMGLGGHNTGSSWGRFMEPNNYYLWEWLFRQDKSKGGDCSGLKNASVRLILHMQLHKLGIEQDLWHFQQALDSANHK